MLQVKNYSVGKDGPDSRLINGSIAVWVAAKSKTPPTEAAQITNATVTQPVASPAAAIYKWERKKTTRFPRN